MPDFGSIIPGSNPPGTHQFFDKFFMMHVWTLLIELINAKYTLQLQKCSEMKLKRNLELLVTEFNPGPEYSANPIMVTPIWKW